jgi:hypothetical protein
MELYTEQLYMRQLEAGDWGFFLALHTEPAAIQYVYDAPSETETREKFESRLPQWLRLPPLVVLNRLRSAERSCRWGNGTEACAR